MTSSDGFKQRYFEATLEFGRVKGRAPTPEEMIKYVTNELRRADEFSPSSASRWKNGEMPNVPTIAAIAKYFYVDPGWLAFGELSMAPAPGLTTQAKLVEMVGKVQKVVRDEQTKTAAPKRKKAQKG